MDSCPLLLNHRPPPPDLKRNLLIIAVDTYDTMLIFKRGQGHTNQTIPSPFRCFLMYKIRKGFQVKCARE